MRALKLSLPLILIVSVLLLSAAQTSDASKQGGNHARQTESHKQETAAQDQQTISPAFTAAILGELRAIVSEEVAKRKQDHTDHKDWNTKPFWITFALTAALVIVGAVYSFVAYLQWTAIREQSEVGRITARAAERSTEIAEQNQSPVPC